MLKTSFTDEEVREKYNPDKLNKWIWLRQYYKPVFTPEYVDITSQLIDLYNQRKVITDKKTLSSIDNTIKSLKKPESLYQYWYHGKIKSIIKFQNLKYL